VGIITDMNGNNSSGSKRLLRIRQGRMVAGVCTGLAAYFGVDVNLVRLAFGVFTVFYGLGILLYLIAWVILPEDNEDGSILETFINKRRQ
jgi:phage shock protein PspC (stress-responsive transcriptional regulator)